MIESIGRSILDSPPEPVIGLAEGETRWRVMTKVGGETRWRVMTLELHFIVVPAVFINT